MYKITLLADLHIPSFISLDYALELFDSAFRNGADHVVFAGDITDMADTELTSEFMAALKKKSFATPEKLTIVPGNHDIFPASENSKLKSARELVFGKTPTSRRMAFYEATNSCMKINDDVCTGPLIKGDLYPIGKRLSEHVCLAALDTTRKGKYSPTAWSRGELAKQHVDAVTEYFAKNNHCRHKIVVMHNYPWRREESRSVFKFNMVEPSPEQAVEWLALTGATMVLCGHLHLYQDIRLGNKLRGIMASAASQVGIKLHDDGEVSG